MDYRTSRTKTDERLGWNVINWSYFRQPHDALASLILFAIFLLMIALGGRMLYRIFDVAYGGTADELNKLLLGFGGLVAAPFFVWRVLISAQQVSIAREANLTALLTKATEQLGAVREVAPVLGQSSEYGPSAPAKQMRPNIEVRLGAIYSLQRIAQESERDHTPIIETLCAYVRSNAGPAEKWLQESIASESDASELTFEVSSDQGDLIPSMDVQAALRAIGRRSSSRREYEKRLQESFVNEAVFELGLMGCSLRKCDFQKLHLEGVKLDGSDLSLSIFSSAFFDQASFVECNLYRCVFYLARLNGANFESANLSRSWLGHAEVLDVRFDDRTLLKDAWLGDLDLSAVQGLTQAHLDSAFGNGRTLIPDGLERPGFWLSADATDDEEESYLHRWSIDPASNKPQSFDLSRVWPKEFT